MKLNKNLVDGFCAMFGTIMGLYAGALAVSKLPDIKPKTKETEEVAETTEE